MRKPRRESFKETGIFHKMWRPHNREPVLESPEERDFYLTHLEDTYTEAISNDVLWHSYCLMSNRPHETVRVLVDDEHELEQSLSSLTKWMRNAHSRFGQGYNRRHDRQGKVAYDRPKTKEIDDEEGLLLVMFCSDANPVAAGKVSHPRLYRDSSYRFYALGEESRHTKCLTPPPAYLALGQTARQRQKRYRQLCDRYLRRVGLIDDRPSEEVEEPFTDDERRAGTAEDNGDSGGAISGVEVPTRR